MRNGTPRLSSLARATALFERILADAGSSTVAALARSIDMPVATAHRHAATLVEAGLLRKVGGGRLVAGPLLFSLFRRVDEKQVLALSAAPVIHEVSRRLDGVVQLGTFENDMVTYRLKAGRQARSLFTEVGMQLEAYCSAVGKALLAHLPEGPRQAYLAGGPFVALTANTITDPDRLAGELEQVRRAGFAVDDEEVAEGLFCVAVPVFAPDGSVQAAISLSRARGETSRADCPLLAEDLQGGASRIELATYGAAFDRA